MWFRVYSLSSVTLVSVVIPKESHSMLLSLSKGLPVKKITRKQVVVILAKVGLYPPLQELTFIKKPP